MIRVHSLQVFGEPQPIQLCRDRRRRVLLETRKKGTSPAIRVGRLFLFTRGTAGCEVIHVLVDTACPCDVDGDRSKHGSIHACAQLTVRFHTFQERKRPIASPVHR